MSPMTPTKFLELMPRPRRSHVFRLAVDVLSAAAHIEESKREAATRASFGIEVARLLGRERSTVYKSLHRLAALGLLHDEWRGGRRYYRLSEFGWRSVVRARLGARVFGRTDEKLRRVRG